jgi:hypothetical protein
MSDKMKIVDSDGFVKYLLEDNKITDLKKHTCEEYILDNEHLVCRECGKELVNPIQEDE